MVTCASRRFKSPQWLILAPVIAQGVLSIQPAWAQDVSQRIAMGGQIHVTASYQVNHTIIIPSNTQITCDPGASLFDGPGLKLNSVVQIKGQNISIDGCGIFSNGATVVVALGSHSSDIHLAHNHIHSFNHAHGLLIDAPDIHGVRIENNTFDNLKYGILQNVHAPDLSDVSIDGNSFSEIWADAIEINDPVTSNCCGVQLTTTRASGITITNNQFSVVKHPGSNASAGFCVGVAGAYNIEISDNDCVSWSEGVHVEDRAYNIKILRNTITTNDVPSNTTQAAIWINDGQHMSIVQNKIINAGGDGIFITYDPSHQASDIEITGNEINGCGRYGLLIAGGSLGPMNTVVHDNKISGCPIPVYLTGKLKALSFHTNHLEAKSGCVFHLDKSTNVGDLDITDNKDTASGQAANATCGT